MWMIDVDSMREPFASLSPHLFNDIRYDSLLPVTCLRSVLPIFGIMLAFR
jgi:hypothetical protein